MTYDGEAFVLTSFAKKLDARHSEIGTIATTERMDVDVAMSE